MHTQQAHGDPDHRVDRALRSSVDDRIQRTKIVRHGADIDDAAALVTKDLHRLSRRQQQAQHVNVEMPVKVLFRYLFETCQIIDARNV